VQTALRDLTGWGPRDLLVPPRYVFGGRHADVGVLGRSLPMVYLLGACGLLCKPNPPRRFLQRVPLGSSAMAAFFKRQPAAVARLCDFAAASCIERDGRLSPIQRTVALFWVQTFLPQGSYTQLVLACSTACWCGAARAGGGFASSFALLLRMLERIQRWQGEVP